MGQSVNVSLDDGNDVDSVAAKSQQARMLALVSILLRRSFQLSALKRSRLLLLLLSCLFLFPFLEEHRTRETEDEKKNWLYKDAVRDGDGITLFVLSDSSSRWDHELFRARDYRWQYD